MSTDFEAERLRVISGSNWFTVTTTSGTIGTGSIPSTIEPSGSLTRGGNGQLYKSVGGGNWGQLGLYGFAMREVPTTSSTGLSTWANQPTNATVNNGAQGMTVFSPSQGSSNNWATLTRSAPATPYSVKMLLAHTHTPGVDATCTFGWVSGSGGRGLTFHWEPDNSAVNSLRVFSATAWVGASYVQLYSSEGVRGSTLWVKLTDDGTTASWSISATGDDDQWISIYSVTKAGSFLDTNGYNFVYFGVSGFSGISIGKILSWQVTSP